MIVLFLLRAVRSVIGWLSSVLPDWTVPWPAPVTFTAPVPAVTTAQVQLLNTWLAASISVAGALLVARVVRWVYALVPFNGGS